MNIRQLANQMGYTWWCPGCKCTHAVNVHSPRPPSWGFNNNVEAPTFTPSVLARGIKQDLTDKQLEQYDLDCERLEHDELLAHPVYGERCHVFITNGQIQFLDDCTHALKGQTVPIPAWPYPAGEYGGIIDP
jgi:hypothetical protein